MVIRINNTYIVKLSGKTGEPGYDNLSPCKISSPPFWTCEPPRLEAYILNPEFSGSHYKCTTHDPHDAFSSAIIFCVTV